MLGEKKQSQNVGKLGACAEGSCMLLGRLDLIYMCVHENRIFGRLQFKGRWEKRRSSRRGGAGINGGTSPWLSG